MREFYAKKYVLWLLLLATGAVGCHQEPVVPVSGIPPTCQIYRIANVNEGVRDTTTFQYNSFGNLTETNYRQWVNGSLLTTSVQKFTYNSDYFLTAQTDQTTNYIKGGTLNQTSKMYSYTYQDGQVQQVAINNTQSGQPIGFRRYTYESGKLKTYAETNAQNVALQTYTFDGAGKLVGYNELGVTSTIDNGKITKKTRQSGATTAYQFDTQGQLQSEVTATDSIQIERTYVYDSKLNWNKTQLLFRGIPAPDLGGHSLVHNVIESSVKQIQNGRTVQAPPFTYQLAYTTAGYLLSYTRSDGAQQKIVYANCL